MRVGVIGAGGHSRAVHLPALAELASLRDVALVAVADAHLPAAEYAAATFGFGASYDDPRRMFDAHALDACLIITPTPSIPELMIESISRSIPCLVEKPFAPSSAEGFRTLERLGGARVLSMVSANRRFDPALAAALAWLGDKPVGWTAVMSRSGRTERDFVFNTGIHLVDVLAHVGGPVVHVESTRTVVDGTPWVQAVMAAGPDAAGTVAFTPTAGVDTEEITFLASGRSVRVRFGSVGNSGWDGWAEGSAVGDSTALLPPWHRDGTLAETQAFLDAVEHGGPSPVPLRDFLESMRLAESLNGPVGGRGRD